MLRAHERSAPQQSHAGGAKRGETPENRTDRRVPALSPPAPKAAGAEAVG